MGPIGVAAVPVVPVAGAGGNSMDLASVVAHRNSVAPVQSAAQIAVVPLIHRVACFRYLPQEPLAVGVAAEADHYGFQILE